jgi:hypothetical protein
VLKKLSTKIKPAEGENLSAWNEAITKARLRIKEIKRSIRTFESLRDSGMEFPEPKNKRSRKVKQSEAKNEVAQ